MSESLQVEYSEGFIFEPFLKEGLVAAVSGRRDGNMSLNYGETGNSLQNRINFLNRLGIDHRSLVCAKQEHGGNVFLAKEKDRGRGAYAYASAIPGTDALITNCRGLPLAVFTADCLSVFLFDRRNSAIGIAHSGWRSLKERIVAKTLDSMREEFGTDSAYVLALLGPAIRECCYEVGEEFRGYFPGAVSEAGGLLHFDLAKAALNQLLDCGVRRENIFDLKICTSCGNQRMFSFRKEKENCGRMMSVLMIR